MSSLFSRALALLVIVVSLSVAGCDAVTSSDSSPEWVGDWEIIESFGDAPPTTTYYSYTEESLTIFRAKQEEPGCDISRAEIVNVEDDRVTLQFGSNLSTERLEVSEERITGTIVRNNFASNEGETFEGVSVDGDPKELIGGGCQQSGVKSSKADPRLEPARSK